jgi:hypothetical protein
MSVGGVFTLINNNGVQDKLIMASDALRKRIKEISCERLSELRKKYPGVKDSDIMKKTQNWMPTLAAIEKRHILFVNATFKPFVAMAHEYSKTPPKGAPAFGGTFNFTMPVIGEFVNDAVVYFKLEGFSAKNSLDKVRYVELLGHRICKTTRFKLNEVELDSYTSDRHNVKYQFHVPQNKEAGYLRCMGQEVPKLGFLTADPRVDEVREYRYFADGPQTFRTVQPTLELWIPLLFWFKDIQTSLPNFLFPYGQTNVEIELEKEDNLLAFANYSGNTGQLYNSPVIKECSLYMNHIFLLPEIHKIFMKRFGFQLIRVTRTHRVPVLSSSEGSVLLQQIKWPIECLYVAFRPTINLTNSQRWHKNTVITANEVKQSVVTGGSTTQINDAIYYSEEHVVSSLSLRAHDITIYPELPPSFYNSYLPMRYGTNLKTPRDIGWYMMNFNINPGDYQPSGHFNSSRDRELYLSYVSAIDPSLRVPYIRAANPVELIVVADCINFLLVANNTAILRFST